jgi:hypothetical protein
MCGVLTRIRNSRWLDFTGINPRRMLFMRKFSLPIDWDFLTVFSGCEPLTPDDIAEVVVFAAGRRENVVLADSLIFPNHQVGLIFFCNI